MDRELARAKVSANRVAVVVANEWKDANDKVMPVKQWLEERRLYQACYVKTLSLFLRIHISAKQSVKLKFCRNNLKCCITLFICFLCYHKEVHVFKISMLQIVGLLTFTTELRHAENLE